MAEELVSTVGILATSKASCNVVKADENGLVILSEYPQMTNGTCIGGGGYFEGKGIVIGEGNSLVGDDASWASNIVIGCNACVGINGGAYSSDNIAIGNGAKAINGRSTALGFYASASGGCSIALGLCAEASGDWATALGYCANASCGYSTAVGYYAKASGCASTALGPFACASAYASTALGYGAVATGAGALAMGYCAEAAENEIVLRSVDDAGTACNVLKVSSEGVLTLNGEEVGGLDISQGIVIGEGATATCVCGEKTDVFVDNVAIGTGAVANQEGGIAIGCSIASGKAGVAMGYCANASGSTSTALGVDAKASGGSSTALGRKTSASGTQSTALGFYANASGITSTALGPMACATGQSSTALGFRACASGASSTALGAGTIALGGASIALGNGASTSGSGALAMGYYAAAGENEIVLRSVDDAGTACNVLKVSSTGVLTLNNTEIKPTCVVTDLQTILASATTVDTTDNAFTLKQVADSLNTLITLLKGTATATTE